MQPRKLIMENFGPFIHEELDFTDFENSGLFLISGKTGAGKTTIFDGMTYALFGQTSGSKRQGKEMRSLFAEPTEETSVFFEFEHNEVFYQIERKPEQILAKKRGVGTTKRGMKATLTVLNSQGKPKEQFSKNVDGKIQDLLHLTADQFFKIIMLPQGEFRNFLIASSKDKEQVLQKLFDTDIYQSLNERLKIKTAQSQKAIDEATLRGETLAGYFKWQGEEVASVGFQEKLTDWQSDIDLLAEEIKEAQAQLANLTEKVKGAEQEFYQGQEKNKRFDEQQELLLRQAELQQVATEQAQAKKLIARLEWYKEHQQLLQNIEEQAHSVEQNQRRIAESELLKEKIASDLLDWQGRRAEVAQQEAQMKKVAREIQQLQSLLPMAEKFQEQNDSLASQQAAIALERTKISDSQDQQKTLQDKISKAKQVVAQKDTWQKNEIQLIKLEQKQEAWQSATKLVEQAQQDIQQSQAHLTELTTQLEATTREKSQLQQTYQAAKQANLRLQIARLSLELEEGAPCPVCGSLEHPLQNANHQKVSHAEIQASETQLNKSEQALTKKEQEFASLSATFEMKQATLEQQKDHLQELEKQAQAALAIITAELAQGNGQPDEVNQLLKERFNAHELLGQQIEQAQNELQQYEAVLAQEIEQEQQLKTTLEEKQAQVTRLQGQMAELKQQLAEQTVTSITEQLASLQKEQADLTTKITEDARMGENLRNQESVYQQQAKDLKERQAELEEQVKVKQSQLEKALATSPEGVAEMLATNFTYEPQQLLTLQQELRTWEEQVSFVNNRLAELADLLRDEKPVDLASLTTTFESSQAEQQLAQESLVKLQGQLENNQQLHQQLTSLVKENQVKLAELAELQQLSETINGRNPYKTSLERYVLQAYLAEVLEVANTRLQVLSKGRYRFELAASTEGRGQKGLDIDVYDDDAGSTRRVQTLSGGESFIAALALALALADVIQNRAGGIPIEALFIDEGFGSLDEEALEMALEALMSIEGEGRVIGIISHVAQLKERLTRQVLVETNGAGQSQIKVKL